MYDNVSAFEAIVIGFFTVFTLPSGQTFATLVRAWVQCLGRPTIRRLLAAGGDGAKSASCYYRFFSRARWDFDDLWRWLLMSVLVPLFASDGLLVFACDDTTCGKFGRRVAFASRFRDAVHSTAAHPVLHLAHCWVIITMQIRLPLWKHVISFPVMARLYRVEADCDRDHPFRTRQDLALEMIRKIAFWLPGRRIELVADGAYPCEQLITKRPANVTFTSRMRSDGALYDLLVQPRKRRRGRPRLKGKRLPCPAELARKAEGWKLATLVQYGEERQRLIWSKKVLWWRVARAAPVLLVIVRDPQGKEDDDFFFTTDLEAQGAHVGEVFASRWGIEEVFREGKQLVGFSKVQGWRPESVEREAPFAMLVLSLVKVWYVTHIALREKPETLPPTSQMLMTLRLAYWEQRINSLSLPKRESRVIIGALRNALAAAA